MVQLNCSVSFIEVFLIFVRHISLDLKRTFLQHLKPNFCAVLDITKSKTLQS